ncbi:hypothetical protein CENSYa_1098 [Cenarchaeum symbiosum A]|uniref:Uncharacterized protein n=1 Tax=Cenarchaeum symbiosum (strain A) TaxID=414004 RepID=A0RWL0_CENSY|nr:hypothetical protein CENSYa_1098 [Cenarchaeum symbiosum A]
MISRSPPVTPRTPRDAKSASRPGPALWMRCNPFPPGKHAVPAEETGPGMVMTECRAEKARRQNRMFSRPGDLE